MQFSTTKLFWLSILCLATGHTCLYASTEKRPRDEAASSSAAPAAEPPSTPPAKKPRLSVAISPQSAVVPAVNTARTILGLLAEEKRERALGELNVWYKCIPGIMQKIKWATTEPSYFRYNMDSALLYSIFLCLANSASANETLTLTKPSAEQDSKNTNQVSVELGNTLLSGTIQRKSKDPSRITFTCKSLPGKKALVYNPENAIKKAFTEKLFSTDETQDFVSMVGKIINTIPQYMREQKEQFYHTLIYGMIRFMGSSLPIVEAYTGAGRADLILQSSYGSKNCIIEFKYNDSAANALAQIKSKQYQKIFGKETVKAIGINIAGLDRLTVTSKEKMLRYEEPIVTRKGDECSLVIS